MAIHIKKRYIVTIEEVLSRDVEVEAENPKEAFIKVQQQYKDGDIVLDADDFADVTFGIIK